MPADLPSGYSSGTLTIAANTATDLGLAIQTQVDTQASMSATILNISADSANTQPVLVGMSKQMGVANYGRSILAGQSANYGAGAQAAVQVSRFYVFSTASAVLHIELLP